MEDYEEISPDDIQVGDFVTLKYGSNMHGHGSFGPWSEINSRKGKPRWLEVFSMNDTQMSGFLGIDRQPIGDFSKDVSGFILDGFYIWVRKLTHKPYDPEQIGDQEDDL